MRLRSYVTELPRQCRYHPICCSDGCKRFLRKASTGVTRSSLFSVVGANYMFRPNPSLSLPIIAIAFLALIANSAGASAQGWSDWNGWDSPRRYRPPVQTYEQSDENDEDWRYETRRRRYYNPRYDNQRETTEPRADRYNRPRDDDRGYEDQDDATQPQQRPRSKDTAEQGKPEGADGGPRAVIQPLAPPLVAFSGQYTPGSIIIDTSARKLYYVTGPAAAYAYPIGVGREGFSWTGSEKVSRITDWPEWYPPAEMRQRKPELPERMLGGLRNPLGAKAIYLGNTLYRIHGTNDPKSIGKAESSGCFRMLNANVLHLASLVHVGTSVSVVRTLNRRPAPVAVSVAAPRSPPRWTEPRNTYSSRYAEPRYRERPIYRPRWSEHEDQIYPGDLR